MEHFAWGDIPFDENDSSNTMVSDEEDNVFVTKVEISDIVSTSDDEEEDPLLTKPKIVYVLSRGDNTDENNADEDGEINTDEDDELNSDDYMEINNINDDDVKTDDDDEVNTDDDVKTDDDNEVNTDDEDNSDDGTTGKVNRMKKEGNYITMSNVVDMMVHLSDDGDYESVDNYYLLVYNIGIALQEIAEENIDVEEVKSQKIDEDFAMADFDRLFNAKLTLIFDTYIDYESDYMSKRHTEPWGDTKLENIIRLLISEFFHYLKTGEVELYPIDYYEEVILKCQDLVTKCSFDCISPSIDYNLSHIIRKAVLFLQITTVEDCETTVCDVVDTVRELVRYTNSAILENNNFIPGKLIMEDKVSNAKIISGHKRDELVHCKYDTLISLCTLGISLITMTILVWILIIELHRCLF